MKKVLPLVLGLTILLAACGTKAPPTLDSAQVMATAVELAKEYAAQTQAAIPTATATVLPTETPTLAPPSPTFALPTFPSIQSTATKATSSDSPCGHVLPSEPTGQKFKLRILNTNKAPVSGSICLYKDRGFGETGVIGVSLTKLADTILSVPQGCYSAYFWVNDPKTPSTASGSGLCANNSDKWTMKITANNVIMLAP